MEAQGEPATHMVGERLVKLARIRASIAPVLSAARQSAQQMEELYNTRGLKDPLYHDMKAVVGPMERLAQRVDQEIDKILKQLGEIPIIDQAQNSPDSRSKLRRRLT
jgi:hypothetical protein